jgi:adenosylmethionine---8-amino-7-oxononanoate aminotransferase
MRSISRSTSAVWHPFTQHAVHGEIPTIVKNEGAWLEAADGRRIFDAISSWWVVVTHGHRYPPIMAEIRAVDRPRSKSR